MALLWMEGWEGFGDANDIYRRYRNDFGSLSLTSSSRGISANSQAVLISFNSSYIDVDVAMGDNNMVLGFAWQQQSTLSNSDIIRTATSALTEQLVIRKTAAGEIALDRGSTNLAITSGLGLIASQWYYIELEATLTDGATGSYTLYVNGNSELTATNVQTRNASGENVDVIRLIGQSTDAHAFDDLYFADGTGTDLTSALGDARIEAVFPDANGTTNNFTASPAVSNYLNVDDGNSPDDDTTYNHSSTATDKDLYGFAALTESIDTVHGVLVRNMVRKIDGGTRGVQNVARSSATESNGTELFIGTSYRYVDSIYENDPNGGGNWTESSVNAAEFGIRISS